MNKKFLTGSNYFFKDIPEFKSKDKDIIILVDNPIGYKQLKQHSDHDICKFYTVRHIPEDYISWYLNTKVPMSVIKFLTKEFCEEIGFTINHLKKLESVFNNLDEKHKYAKIIFDFYIENNDFYLTEEQLLISYKEYKKYRI